jgi:hypothetical protein
LFIPDFLDQTGYLIFWLISAIHIQNEDKDFTI